MSDVPEGYKMSEVGVIPEEWEVKELEKEIDLLTGFPFHSNQYSSSGIRLLRGSNIKRGVTDWSDDITEFWQKITPDLKSYSLKEGDIVIAMDGSLVGRSFARLSKKDLPALLLQRVARIRSNKIDVGYLKEFICSDYFTKYCDSVKTVTAIPHISPSDIKKFQIPLPPTIEEQQAIASALSDVDTLITAREQLITKKRNIKQGAMQQLLTGKKRLPGFGVAWEVRQLGEILKSAKLGGNYPNSEKETNYPLIKMGNINRGFIDLSKIEFITTGYIPSENDKLEYGDILFNTRNTLELVGKVSIWKNELPLAYYNSNLMRLEFKQSEVSSNFFMNYILNTKQSLSQLKGFATGTTSVAAIYTRDLLKLEVPLPPFPEQQAIAQILSDMDTEIEALKQKRDKYKAIKQGMMQELLTGKTRLV